MTRQTTLIRRLVDLRRTDTDTAIVGGKNASTGEMLGALKKDKSNLIGIGKAVRKMILDAGFPPPLARGGLYGRID